jgi:hypothetical protein
MGGGMVRVGKECKRSCGFVDVHMIPYSLNCINITTQAMAHFVLQFYTFETESHVSPGIR